MLREAARTALPYGLITMCILCHRPAIHIISSASVGCVLSSRAETKSKNQPKEALDESADAYPSLLI